MLQLPIRGVDTNVIINGVSGQSLEASIQVTFSQARILGVLKALDSLKPGDVV